MTDSEFIKRKQSQGYTDWQIRHELCARNDHSQCDPLGHRCPKSNCAQGDHSKCTELDFQCPKILSERSPQTDYANFDIARILKSFDLLTGATGVCEYSKYSIDELIGLSLPMITKQNNPKAVDSSEMHKALVEVLIAGVEAARAQLLIEALNHLNAESLPAVTGAIRENSDKVQDLTIGINNFNSKNAAVLSTKLESLVETITSESSAAGFLTKCLIATSIVACLINIGVCGYTAMMAYKTADLAELTKQSVALSQTESSNKMNESVFEAPKLQVRTLAPLWSSGRHQLGPNR